MPNETQQVNDQRSEDEKNDFSHLMISSANYVNPGVEMRDSTNQTMNWNQHPEYGSSTMTTNDANAATATGPMGTHMQQFPSDEAWHRTGGMSMDGLFVPYSTNFVVQSDKGRLDSSNIPSAMSAMSAFERPYSKKTEDGVKDTIPWSTMGHERDLGKNAPSPSLITSASLNPLASGHNINWVNRNRTITNPSIEEAGYASDAAPINRAAEESLDTARPVGLRGPIVMSGWGYDATTGHPVPNLRHDADNRYDEWGSSNYGRQRYVPNQLKAKTKGGMQHDFKHFLPQHMRRPDKWKVGPLDLRWDHQRKVWVGGKHNGIFLSKAAKCILPKAGLDGNNSFNFGVGGNINAPGRLYRNPCASNDCTYTSYFPTSVYYPDIEIYDPEDHNWCGACMTRGDLTACNDFKDGCAPFYDAIIIRPVDEMVGKPNTLTECTDKFRKVQGGSPGMRRAGNPCHGWGSSYFGQKESINEKIGKDETWTQHAKSIMYEKVFIENPLGQGLMVGDAFFSYDTGKRIIYEYQRSTTPSCGAEAGTKITVKEAIPVHIILQAEFYGMEIVTHAGCDRGEMAACSKKFFAQGFATAEDCGPDDDYPQTAGL